MAALRYRRPLLKKEERKTKPKVELEVETKRPNIDYSLRGIVEEMLECGQTYLCETSSYVISLKVGDEEAIKEIVKGRLEINITVPDSFLEKIKGTL